jgi:hypothetical protein
MKWSGLSRQKSGLFKFPFTNILMHCLKREILEKVLSWSPKGFFQNLSPRFRHIVVNACEFF